MSSAQIAPSPRAPRAHQPSSKNANQAPPNNNGNRGQRKPKGNRAHNGNHATGQQSGVGLAPQDLTHAESAILSSEERALPVGPRPPKKHTRSQPSVDRVFSPTTMATASLTDTDIGPAPAATPAKAQGAYAGPTFHASPAPSALPIPKFLSKSVPPKTHSGPPTPPPEEGSDSGSSPSPSPSRGSIPIPSRHQNSPLDMLFKADRAERARNVNCSPLSAPFSPPNALPSNGRPQHVKHDSFGSLNAPFPIELEANSRTTQFSPPAASPGTHRSVTAPSKIPQLEALTQQPTETDAVQDLFKRVSMSQNKAATTTPPKALDRNSSDPALRNHSPSPFHKDRPSPFRSTSGPNTPVPMQPQEGSDLFYGNQNLSSKFKAAKGDPAKRNSGLRTEITADSPIVPQGGFPPFPPTNNDMRGLLGNVLNGPGGPRRGSAPQIAPIPPYRGSPNNQHIRSPGRRTYHPRPDSYPHAKANLAPNAGPTGTPATSQKSSTAMAFIPSSVRAKPPGTPPKKAESDNLVLEQNLKRLLNLGDPNGVR
ncbi:hypothetical protein N0V90_001818 [Kalmusia sp. IMI 367209]|nr:hypothetical protein N0V90_001818 [Kalmusia sp. IMI 367209]